MPYRVNFKVLFPKGVFKHERGKIPLSDYPQVNYAEATSAVFASVPSAFTDLFASASLFLLKMIYKNIICKRSKI